ncbi:MAG TPA: sigma-54 dependent transcriptional regulator [Bacteroidales bacterium]|nr:sigma-54 dependent transcriptional regulator [Bacteroidales bacterium]HPR72998.1 sigma-54 dependent transcriptional regulator [Bacteroidales bacterium]
MKTLISWLAYNNDFIRDPAKNVLKGVNPHGPNFNMHRYFWHSGNYDRHIILYSGRGDSTGVEMLINDINREYKDHLVESINMAIDDPISLSEIKPKVERQLFEIRDDEIVIFASPGTPTMQVAWYICHTSLKLNTRIIQTRPAEKSKTGRPDILEMELEQSATPVSMVIKEKNLEDRGMREDYKITASIKPVYDTAKLIAQNDKTTVLVQGETGTGKEHLARFIHDNSPRSKKPFVTINCSAFGDSLLESRLFGYKKGSFTGADRDTTGLFEKANGGTILLDEIGDISPYMQQSLLRVIQEKEIQPIGGISKPVDVRIISATNRNLADMCRDGKFRWDLYYRLVVTELSLPDLLERGTDDLDEMIRFFIKKKQEEMNKEKAISLSPEARQFLLSYPWPGNVRELENLVENLYACYSGTIKAEDIPRRFKNVPVEESLLWKDVEKRHIEKVMKLKKGNKRQAFYALGYGAYNTFNSRLKEYGIDPDDL